MSRDDPQPQATELPLLLLTVAQAAAMCQVSTDRIYQWSFERGFPAVVEPHQVRIHAALFAKWLEQRAATGRAAEVGEQAEEQPAEESAA